MKKFKLAMVLLLTIAFGCEDEFEAPAIIAPSNLTASASAAVDGLVNFTASAENANYYHFDFGDGTSGLTSTGSISKEYTEIGDNTYTVTVTAGSGESKTITQTLSVAVSIAFSDPETVAALTSGSSKTWYLAASEPGHLGVGPARDGIDGDWWYPKWYAATAFEKCNTEDSDCLCDDELTFTTDGNGGLTYTLDNMGQTYFNGAHKDVVGGTQEGDFCYDFDTTGEKTVVLSGVSGNVPDEETTGIQMDFSDGGFMGYYVGSSTYEILALTDDFLYVRTYDTMNADLAWYHKFASSPATPPVVNAGEPTEAAAAPTADAANVISMFSNAYTDVTVDTWRTDWSAGNLEDLMIAGDDVKKYSALNFVGIETVSSQIDATMMTNFHADIWTADATEFRIKLVDFGPDGAFDGGDDAEHEIVIDAPAQNEWVSLNIPLADFTGLTTKANISQLILSGNPSGAFTVFVDNVYFSMEGTTGGGTDPTTAAPAPTLDAANVISLFSNAYTDVAVDTWRTEWSNATFEDVMVAGDDVKKYSDLNFVGIETVSSQIDATSMTHFHTDIWTAGATEFRIKLVDFGPDGAFDGGDDVEHEVVIANPNQSEWVSLDIPLADFTGLTNTANIAQLIYSGNPSGAFTVYVDNVYFHN